MCVKELLSHLFPSIAEVLHLGNVDWLAVDLGPDYNAAPQSIQSVVWDDSFGTRILRVDTINARRDTLLDSNLWCYAFLHSRCLVPVDSFIEWKRLDAKTILPGCSR
jgi:SOS response associated peptidase (SRAP)